MYRQKLPAFMPLVDVDNANKNINSICFIKHMLCAQNPTYILQCHPHGSLMSRKLGLREVKNSLAYSYTAGELSTCGSNPGSLVP